MYGMTHLQHTSSGADEDFGKGREGRVEGLIDAVITFNIYTLFVHVYSNSCL